MPRFDFRRTQHLARHQQPCRAVIDDFRNPADGGRHDRRLARHRFEVDDSERFVHRRTDEDRRMRVERDDLFLRQHLADPDDAVRALGFRVFRVRHHDDVARLEIAREEMSRALDPEMSAALVRALKPLGFRYISLDLQGYRTGSLNEGLLLRPA